MKQNGEGLVEPQGKSYSGLSEVAPLWDSKTMEPLDGFNKTEIDTEGFQIPNSVVKNFRIKTKNTTMKTFSKKLPKVTERDMVEFIGWLRNRIKDPKYKKNFKSDLEYEDYMVKEFEKLADGSSKFFSTLDVNNDPSIISEKIETEPTKQVKDTEKTKLTMDWNGNKPFNFTVEPWLVANCINDKADGLYIGSLLGDSIDHGTSHISLDIKSASSTPVEVLCLIKGGKVYIFKRSQLGTDTKTFSVDDKSYMIYVKDGDQGSIDPFYLKSGHKWELEDWCKSEGIKAFIIFRTEGEAKKFKRLYLSSFEAEESGDYQKAKDLLDEAYELSKSSVGGRMFSKDEQQRYSKSFSDTEVPESIISKLKEIAQSTGCINQSDIDKMQYFPLKGRKISYLYRVLKEKGELTEKQCENLKEILTVTKSFSDGMNYDYRFSIIPTEVSYEMSYIIGSWMMAASVCHLYHICDQKYAGHMALDEFYTEFPYYIDQLAEHYLADNEKAEFRVCVVPHEDPIDYLDRLIGFTMKYVELNGDKISSPYKSQLDDIVNFTKGILYKLKRLSSGRRIFSAE